MDSISSPSLICTTDEGRRHLLEYLKEIILISTIKPITMDELVNYCYKCFSCNIRELLSIYGYDDVGDFCKDNDPLYDHLQLYTKCNDVGTFDNFTVYFVNKHERENIEDKQRKNNLPVDLRPLPKYIKISWTEYEYLKSKYNKPHSFAREIFINALKVKNAHENPIIYTEFIDMVIRFALDNGFEFKDYHEQPKYELFQNFCKKLSGGKKFSYFKKLFATDFYFNEVKHKYSLTKNPDEILKIIKISKNQRVAIIHRIRHEHFKMKTLREMEKKYSQKNVDDDVDKEVARINSVSSSNSSNCIEAEFIDLNELNEDKGRYSSELELNSDSIKLNKPKDNDSISGESDVDNRYDHQNYTDDEIDLDELDFEKNDDKIKAEEIKIITSDEDDSFDPMYKHVYENNTEGYLKKLNIKSDDESDFKTAPNSEDDDNDEISSSNKELSKNVQYSDDDDSSEDDKTVYTKTETQTNVESRYTFDAIEVEQNLNDFDILDKNKEKQKSFVLYVPPEKRLNTTKWKSKMPKKNDREDILSLYSNNQSQQENKTNDEKAIVPENSIAVDDILKQLDNKPSYQQISKNSSTNSMNLRSGPSYLSVASKNVNEKKFVAQSSPDIQHRQRNEDIKKNKSEDIDLAQNLLLLNQRLRPGLSKEEKLSFVTNRQKINGTESNIHVPRDNNLSRIGVASRESSTIPNEPFQEVKRTFDTYRNRQQQQQQQQLQRPVGTVPTMTDSKSSEPERQSARRLPSEETGPSYLKPRSPLPRNMPPLRRPLPSTSSFSLSRQPVSASQSARFSPLNVNHENRDNDQDWVDAPSPPVPRPIARHPEIARSPYSMNPPPGYENTRSSFHSTISGRQSVNRYPIHPSFNSSEYMDYPLSSNRTLHHHHDYPNYDYHHSAEYRRGLSRQSNDYLPNPGSSEAKTKGLKSAFELLLMSTSSVSDSKLRKLLREHNLPTDPAYIQGCPYRNWVEFIEAEFPDVSFDYNEEVFYRK